MFIFVDVGSGTCKSAYTLFVTKVGVAMAQFLYKYTRSLAVAATGCYWEAVTATCSVMGLVSCNEYAFLYPIEC
jgi:hypothetical protein